VQRDQIVRRHRRAGVVERAIRFGDVERVKPEQPRELACDGAGLRRLARDRRVCPIQLFRPASSRERLERVKPEALRMRVEHLEWRRAARVPDPLGHGECLTPGDLGDRGVRDAEEHDCRAFGPQLDAPLVQAGGHR
jgi:hypothetical protein